MLQTHENVLDSDNSRNLVRNTFKEMILTTFSALSLWYNLLILPTVSL